jgi:hypothetical protein
MPRCFSARHPPTSPLTVYKQRNPKITKMEITTLTLPVVSVPPEQPPIRIHHSLRRLHLRVARTSNSQTLYNFDAGSDDPSQARLKSSCVRIPVPGVRSWFHWYFASVGRRYSQLDIRHICYSVSSFGNLCGNLCCSKTKTKSRR